MNKTLNTAAAALALASFAPASQPRPLADSPICITRAPARIAADSALEKQRLELRDGLQEIAEDAGYRFTDDELNAIWEKVLRENQSPAISDGVRGALRKYRYLLADRDGRVEAWQRLSSEQRKILMLLMECAEAIDPSNPRSDNNKFICAEALRRTGVSKATAYRHVDDLMEELEETQQVWREATSGRPTPRAYSPAKKIRQL